MPVDLMVARDVMACNFMTVVVVLLVTAIRLSRLPREERKKQATLTLPSIIWCFHACVFYSYTFFVKPYHDFIPENDTYYFAWGAAIILHAALNALGIELTRMRVDGH